jgi:1-deoxy-D-xylulose-5-phosphate reductoisomerase
MKKRLIVLGSTGSIGTKTLEVAEDFPDHFEVVALSSHSRVPLLEAQIRRFRPRAICVTSPGHADEATRLAEATGVELHLGTDGLSELVERYEADMVVVATVGFVGLVPTLRAIERGLTIALANKEVLVTAGDLVMQAARDRGVEILPIDSEHNAIFQCLNGSGSRAVRRIILTASGGPFRGSTREDMAAITPEEALRHPTWNMGPKITIDSATLMNKGFEVIEGKHLFGVPVDRIAVLVHPQSTVHSMVEYVDGSIIAQLGVTDMYFPIQNVLLYPERLENKFPPLDLARLGLLSFGEPDHENFPCLNYAYEAARLGGVYPAVLNAANEIAVERFLSGGIPFLKISEIIRHTLDACEKWQSTPDTPSTEADESQVPDTPELHEIHAADRWARAIARTA